MVKPSGVPKREGGPRRKIKDDVIQVSGVVVDSLPNAMFRVEIEMGPTKVDFCFILLDDRHLIH